MDDSCQQFGESLSGNDEKYIMSIKMGYEAPSNKITSLSFFTPLFSTLLLFCFSVLFLKSFAEYARHIR